MKGAMTERPQGHESDTGALLEIKGLRTHFFTQDGTVKAVDGVTFAIKNGQTLGVVGESGCGKSITALSVMRLIERPGKIVEGSIRFDGRNLLELSSDQMQDVRGNSISMIFQEPMTSLNPVYTCGDQISEAVSLHGAVSRKESWARAVDMLGQVGIPDPKRRAKQYPHELSGGMRQRVMIAMALSTQPGPAHRRRADHGARRHDPGPDPRAHEVAPASATGWRSCSSPTTWASSPRWPTTSS